MSVMNRVMSFLVFGAVALYGAGEAQASSKSKTENRKGNKTAKVQPTANTKPFPLLRHEQLLQLSPENRLKYIKGIRDLLVKLSRKNPMIAAAEQNPQHPLWSFLLPSADADETQATRTSYGMTREQAAEHVRCMNGGFVVLATSANQRCNSVREYSVFVPGADGQASAEKTRLSCSPGTGMCNPIVFGLNADNGPICLAPTQSFTASCRSEAAKHNDAARLSQFLQANKVAWDDFGYFFTALCRNDLSQNQYLRGRTGAIRDVQATCLEAETAVADLNQEIGKDVNVVESSSETETATATANAQEPNCRNLGQGLESPAMCYACSIEFSENTAGGSQGNFHVSENWMTLLGVASTVCSKKTGRSVSVEDLLSKFGYCRDNPSWQVLRENDEIMETLKLIGRIPANSMQTKMRDKRMEGNDWQVHLYLNFGIDSKEIEEMFCDMDRQKFGRTATGLVRGTVPSLADPKRPPRDEKRLEGFGLCATEAVNLQLASSSQSAFQFWVPKDAGSRFEARDCKLRDEASRSSAHILNLARERNQPVLVNTKPGECDVTIGYPAEGKLNVLSPVTGSVNELDEARYHDKSLRLLTCKGDNSVKYSTQPTAPARTPSRPATRPTTSPGIDL